MANFSTMSDLREDALFLAGEVSTDTGGSYYTKALDYCNAVLLSVVKGGSLGPEPLPMVDWWWARGGIYGGTTSADGVHDSTNTTRERQLILNPALTTAGTATISTGSPTTCTLSVGGVSNCISWVFRVNTAPIWWTITSDAPSATTLTLGTRWPGASNLSASTDYTLFPAFYPIETQGFIRFTEPLIYEPTGDAIRIIDQAELDDRYPLSSMGQGQPTHAALVSRETLTGFGNATPVLRFSHYPDQNVAVRARFIVAPTGNQAALSSSDEPGLPHQHRRLLSFGAAYLILLDKQDPAASARFSQFADAWHAMAMEQIKQTSEGGRRYGMLLPRPSTLKAAKLTASGLILP